MSKKKVTLAEFKAWLQGVEEMQGSDWAPTTDQWKRIREKIDCIKEQKQPQKANHNSNYNSSVGKTDNVSETISNVSEKNAPTQTEVPAESLIPLPDIPSEFEKIEITPPSTNAMKMLKGNGTTKETPNVDTSNGNYKSDFS